MRTLALAASLLAASAAFADDHAAVEKEILDVVQKEWAAEMRGDVDGMLKSKSKDVTIFDLGNPYRTDYASDNAVIRADAKHGAMLVEQMVNPKVQVFGDVAILTYNMVGVYKGSDGHVSHEYNRGTRVYHKENGQWMLVHGHFSRSTAEP